MRPRACIFAPLLSSAKPNGGRGWGMGAHFVGEKRAPLTRGGKVKRLRSKDFRIQRSEIRDQSY